MTSKSSPKMDADQPNDDTMNASNAQEQAFIFGSNVLRKVSSTGNSNRVLNLVNAIVVTQIFNFFQLSREIRNMVYQELWGDYIVVVNGNCTPGALIYPGFLPDLSIPNATIAFYDRGSIVVGTHRYDIEHSNVRFIHRPWLRISKQFFREAREKLWDCMDVQFDRRWDLINAAMNRSLDPRSPFELLPAPPVGSESWAMFPFQVDLFQNIRNLHIDMSSFDDFSGVVSSQETCRLVSHALSRMAYFMPKLKSLLFTIDERSKISDADKVMLPFAWFLELLRNIISHHRKLIAVRFIPGRGFNSGRLPRLNGRYCLQAMDGIFQEHMAAVRGGQGRRLDIEALNGLDLRRYFGLRMIDWFVATNDHRPWYTAVKDLLKVKVDALQ